jgi:predicted metal-dependent peptidase
MTQETAESKLLKARIRLLLTQPFFGNLVLYLEPVERKGMAMPTMATDGDHLFYDPDFVMNLPTEHLIGVMVHEILMQLTQEFSELYWMRLLQHSRMNPTLN